MKIGKKILALSAIFLMLFSTFAIISRNIITTAQPSDDAELTGNISDIGVDTDSDGSFDYLEVEVEINVSSPGYYQIEVPYLIDSLSHTYYVWCYNESYLYAGFQWLSLSFYGPRIYVDKFNVSGVGEIRLYEGYSMIDSVYDVPLSKEYNYAEFDCRAVLTGNIYDEGVDTDGDGLFNSLQIGVEINVTDAATYEVYVSGLYGTTWLYVYNYSTSFLDPGIQILNVSLNGAKIYGSHGNFSSIDSISLSIYEDYYYYTLQYIYDAALDRTYSYDEFDALAFFTGKIFDEGIDEDSNGLYDYLKISVEINVTDAGYYTIQLENLLDDYFNYLYEYQSFTSEFDVGVYLINFTVYGPKIYGAHMNPVYIEYLSLRYEYYPWEWITLEKMGMVLLPVLYDYTQFESHAFLTGNIQDRGFDADGDGLFDYLEVGVEINVTEAGIYGLSVGGLAEEINGNDTREIGYYQYSENDLSLGIHVINFSLPGPMIAYYHINPMNITYLHLTETSYGQLSFLRTVALSTKYNCTQFNSPLRDVQVEFTVYPNATIGVNGLMNYTRIYPEYYYYEPSVNATLGFSTSGDTTTGSVNGTMIVPQYSLNQFPYNSTTVDFTSEYYNHMLNAQLDASMFMPTSGSTTYPTNSSDFSFLGTYSDGILNAHLWGETELPSYFASQFPFNASDVTVRADYVDNEIKGNITFHMVSGFPLGDVIVHFNGTKTAISFTGYVNVIYGNYSGMEVSATVLEEMLSEINSTIPGQGEGSLYNMTNGMVECTVLNTTKTPIGDPEIGATVDYNATISGNFTKLLATYLTEMIFGYYHEEWVESTVYAALDSTLSSVDNASLILNYYYGSGIASIDLTLNSDVKALWNSALQLIPPTLPPEYMSQVEAWLKIANATTYAVENVDIIADYSSAAQQLDLHASLTANVTQLKNEIIPILSDAVPPQFRDLVEKCTNTTYCTLDSLNTTCNYVNGVTNFNADWLISGDFTAELNLMKSCYIEYLNLTNPYQVDWRMWMLNATEIDISNFKADVRQGEDWMTLTFEGLKAHPVKDEIDFIRFKLYQFFNMSSDPYESPREFEKLKIIIKGGANATHTILLYTPYTMPSPDEFTLNYTSMTWENTTLSGMRDLVFKIAYQGVVNYLGTYYVPIFTNSTVSNFQFNPSAKSISFNVTGTSGTGFSEITIPRVLLYAAPEEWIIRFDGTILTSGNFTVDENAEYVFINLNYSHSEHSIEIIGTSIIAEFQPNILLLILATLSLIVAVIAVKQRKKLSAITTRYKSAIHAFANKLHQLRT